MFEPGAYSVVSRIVNLLYKGGVFSVIGFGAGIFGTATSTGLLNMRKVLDPSFELQNDPPNVILNAACWGLHMGASANLRYQVLGAADLVSDTRCLTTVHKIRRRCLSAVSEIAVTAALKTTAVCVVLGLSPRPPCQRPVEN